MVNITSNIINIQKNNIPTNRYIFITKYRKKNYSVKTVNKTPNKIAINFCKLNLWFSVLSKRIIVEICKKTPIIKAVISVAYVVKNRILSPNKTPKGLMNPKKNRKLKTIFFEYFVSSKNEVNTIAIGIL